MESLAGKEDHARVVDWAFEYVGVTHDDSFDEISNMIAAFSQEQRPIHEFEYAKNIVLSLTRYKKFCDNSEYNAKFIPTSEQTSFQSLLLFLLRRFHELNYRRLGNMLYQRLRDENGVYMHHAWTPVCTVKEFVQRDIRKESEPEQWKNLTNPRDNMDIVCRHLTEVEHPELSKLNMDYTLISWKNGTYSIRDNVFWANDQIEHWDTMAHQVEVDRIRQGWGESYRLVPPSMHISSCHFIDKPFRLQSEDSTVVADVCTLLVDMGIDQSVHWWFFVLLGRLLFPINKHDQWCVMPFFKTSEHADNAAMTMFVETFQDLIGQEHVEYVSSGTNTQYSLEMLMNARISAMLLRDTTMPLEQGDWQSVLCGEPVCINSATRGRTSFSHQWTSHMFAVGKNLSYKNDAGTVDRRIIMFDMSSATPEMFQKLRNLIRSNVDIWLQTTVDAYLTAVNEYAASDIWDENVLPQNMHAMRQSVREITTPLLSCILSSLFLREANLFMPLADFKEMYQDYRRQRGLPQQRWVRDHWHATFQDMNLTVERSQKEYNGAKSTTDWICGIDSAQRSSANAVTITQETIAQLSREQIRVGSELERLEQRLGIARKLYALEENIQSLKQTRNELRKQYHDMEDVSGAVA